MVGMLAKKVLAAGVGLDLRSARQKQGTADRQDDMQRCREEQPWATAQPWTTKVQYFKIRSTQRGQAKRGLLAASQKLVRRLRQRRRGTREWKDKNRQNKRCFALGMSTTVNDNGLEWGSGSRAPGKLDGFPNTGCRLGTPGAVEGALSLREEAEQRDDGESRGEGPCWSASLEGRVWHAAQRHQEGIKSQVKSW